MAKESKGKTGSRDRDHGKAGKESARRKAEDTFAFWTKENMQQAKPLTIERDRPKSPKPKDKTDG